MINPTNLNQLVLALKEQEIMHHRMKIVHLSKCITEHPEELSLGICLKQS